MTSVLVADGYVLVPCGRIEAVVSLTLWKYFLDIAAMRLVFTGANSTSLDVDLIGLSSRKFACQCGSDAFYLFWPLACYSISQRSQWNAGDGVVWRLFGNGSRIKLVGKPYEMLIVLLENPGTTVTREALRMRLWPKGGPVDHYSNVSTIVSKLRRILGETEREPSIIATIPGRLQLHREDRIPKSTDGRNRAALRTGSGSRNIAVTAADRPVALGIETGRRRVHGRGSRIVYCRGPARRGNYPLFPLAGRLRRCR